MASLPSNNIGVIDVSNILGVPSYDVGVLCGSQRVNRYARFRPGYWDYDGASRTLYFHRPQGAPYQDPRGTDPDTGESLQVYTLAHFRDYNHDAPAVGATNEDAVITIPSSQSGLTPIPYTLGFSLGEVDWKGDEPRYRGRNNIPPAFTHFVVKCDQLATAENHGMIGRVVIPTTAVGEYTDAQVEVSLPVPAYGNVTKIYVFEYGLSTGNSALFAKFDGIQTTVKLTKMMAPQANYLIPDTSYGIVKSNAQGILASDRTMPLYDVLVSGGVIAVPLGTSTVRFSDLYVSLYLKDPSSSREAYYDVVTSKWAISGYVQEWDSTNSREVGRVDFSITLSGNATGALSGIVDIGTNAKDGHVYNVFVTGSGLFSVTKQA